MYQHADKEGIVGVELDKQLVHVAGKSLQVRQRQLASLIGSCTTVSLCRLYDRQCLSYWLQCRASNLVS